EEKQSSARHPLYSELFLSCVGARRCVGARHRSNFLHLECENGKLLLFFVYELCGCLAPNRTPSSPLSPSHPKLFKVPIDTKKVYCYCYTHKCITVTL